jgi:DNA-directed RNA polymerase-3 subunit RPC5
MGDITMVDVDQARPDPDPIKASYDVYIKPGISGDRQVYVLQFPNRHAKQHYSQENDSKPFDLRIKPESGMVEVDVPIDVYRNYDRQKGVTWGDAAKKSSLAKGGGSHGMPGGFGIGGAQPNARGRGRAEAEDDTNEERLLEDFDGAVQRGQVLKKQTLGGQFVLKEDTSPQYMIGVWREGKSLTSCGHYFS